VSSKEQLSQSNSLTFFCCSLIFLFVFIGVKVVGSSRRLAVVKA
jgi:hypothetical protein